MHIMVGSCCRKRRVAFQALPASAQLVCLLPMVVWNLTDNPVVEYARRTRRRTCRAFSESVYVDHLTVCTYVAVTKYTTWTVRASGGQPGRGDTQHSAVRYAQAIFVEALFGVGRGRPQSSSSSVRRAGHVHEAGLPVGPPGPSARESRWIHPSARAPVVRHWGRPRAVPHNCTVPLLTTCPATIRTWMNRRPRSSRRRTRWRHRPMTTPSCGATTARRSSFSTSLAWSAKPSRSTSGTTSSKASSVNCMATVSHHCRRSKATVMADEHTCPGFSKTTLRNGDSEFRHPLFVRGRPDLLKQIGRKAADAQEEQKQRTRAMEEQMRWLVEENERLHSIVRLLFEDHAILSARIRMYEPDDVMSAPAAAASAYYHGSQQGQPAMGSASPGRDAMRPASADQDGMRSMPLCYEQQQQQQQVEPAFGTSRSNFVLPRYDSQQMQPAAGSPVPNRDGMPSRSSSTTTDETAAGASGGGIEPGAGVPPASSGGSAIPPDGRDVTHRQANPIARRFTPYIINK